MRALAIAGVAVIALSGVEAPQPAQAAGVITGDTLNLDAPNPVASISLNSNFEQQFVSRTLGGKAFFGADASPSAMPIIFDFDSQRNLTPISGRSLQTSGGEGTAADPYWLETTGEVSGESRLTMTQRLSYVLGTEYMRNDISLRNEGASVRTLRIAQFADCFFRGSDVGTSNVVPGRMAQCVNGDKAMSLIAFTPDASLLAGHYSGVRNALMGPSTGSTLEEGCVDSASGSMACSVSLDNGFGAAWKGTISPGEVFDVTTYLSYTDALAFVDLVASGAVSSETVVLGETVEYNLSLENRGADPAITNTVSFSLPEGMSFVSAEGDGTYDPEGGVWSVPSLNAGSSARLSITARADAPGMHSTRIVATSSEGVDLTPCHLSEGCGDALEVAVLERGNAEKSTIAAAPTRVVADGESASRIQITAFDSSGERVHIGGAGVQLSTGLGELSAVIDNQDGTYTADLTSTRPGNALIAFSMDGAEGNSTAQVEFVSGPADLQNEGTRYAVTEGDAPVSGGSHQVVVTILDAQGNAVSGQSGELQAATEDDLGGGTITEFEETSDPGTYSATVTSTVVGAKAISVQHAGSAVILEGNGIAAFVPGAPDPATAVLEAPESISADGVDSGDVTLTVYDAHGNRVTDEMPVTIAATIGEFAEVTYSGNGEYSAALKSTTPGMALITAEVDGSPVEATAEVRLINRVPPAAPVLDPSDGENAPGCAEAGTTVTVYDADRNVIGNSAADDDCRFEIGLSPEQEPGSIIFVTATDVDDNESQASELRVGPLALTLLEEALYLGERQGATGQFFQSGEAVVAYIDSVEEPLGEFVADADGKVEFEFDLSGSVDVGRHSVALSGAFSGDVVADFQVEAQPQPPVAKKEGEPEVKPQTPTLAATGSNSHYYLASFGAAVLGAGALFIALSRRLMGNSRDV